MVRRLQRGPVLLFVSTITRYSFQVIEALREHERLAGRHLLTIALTARARAEDCARGFAAGMDEFLAKPIQAATLWATIERIRGTAVPAREGESRPPRRGTLVSADVLLASCGGDPIVLEAIRSGLRVRLPESLATLARTFEEHDAAQLREAAHTTFGMLAAFSSLAGGIASTLEDIAASGELTGAGELIEQLRAIAPVLLREIDAVTIESLAER